MRSVGNEDGNDIRRRNSEMRRKIQCHGKGEAQIGDKEKNDTDYHSGFRGYYKTEYLRKQIDGRAYDDQGNKCGAADISAVNKERDEDHCEIKSQTCHADRCMKDIRQACGEYADRIQSETCKDEQTDRHTVA